MVRTDIIKYSFQYACCVTGLVQGTEKITKNETHKIPALVEFTIKPAVKVLNVSTTYCEIKRLRQQTAGKLRS